MFEVIDKESLKTFVVYAIRDDVCGYPQFLVYDFIDGAWYWKSAKYFHPVEEREE